MNKLLPTTKASIRLAHGTNTFALSSNLIPREVVRVAWTLLSFDAFLALKLNLNTDKTVE